MKRRMIGAAIAAASVLAVIPAGSQAETVDTTCHEGKEPLVFLHVNVKPVMETSQCVGGENE